MGDNRCELKIKFSIYQDTFEMDSSVNYIPDSDGVASFIKEWFAEKYEIARNNWEEIIFKEEREQKKKRERLARKALYIELKNEFENEL